MNIQTVDRVARLARLRFSEEEKSMIAGELTKIMGWIDRLQEVNTDGVEPLHSPVTSPLPLRDDVVNDGNIPEKLMKNAPLAEHQCFAVPKVIE